jgi:hypothetical protein
LRKGFWTLSLLKGSKRWGLLSFTKAEEEEGDTKGGIVILDKFKDLWSFLKIKIHYLSTHNLLK